LEFLFSGSSGVVEGGSVNELGITGEEKGRRGRFLSGGFRVFFLFLFRSGGVDRGLLFFGRVSFFLFFPSFRWALYLS